MQNDIFLKKNGKIEYLLNILTLTILLVLSVFAIVKTIFVSFDIDEGYAIAQAYRMVQGDHLVANMWEPHQFSGYFSAIFVWFFLKITGGAIGIVVFLRIVGTLIHLLIGLYFIYTFRQMVPHHIQILLFLLHMNFLPKWLQIPEFELMSYWFLLLSGCFMWKFFSQKKRSLYLILLGLCMLLQVANYPTLIFLYPIYMYGLFKMSERPIREMIISTLAALIPGICFIAYLFSYMDFKTFQIAIKNILSDPSHATVKISSKILSYGIELLVDAVLLVAVFGICYFFLLFFKKIKERRVFMAFLFGSILLEFIHVIGCLFFDQNQFFMQERYFFFFLFYLYARKNIGQYKEKERCLFYFCIIPAVTATIMAALLSNMTLSVAYSKLFICIPMLIIIFFMDKRDISQKRFWEYASIVFTIGGLIVCKLLLIRVTGCLPLTLNARMEKIADGPVKGIYVIEETARAYNNDFPFISENINSRDKLFYFGAETITYLYTKAEVCTASVQGTSVFNQTFLDYFFMHPDKFPTVIAVDKEFEKADFYRYHPDSNAVKEWIATLRYDKKIETEYMDLYIGVSQ